MKITDIQLRSVPISRYAPNIDVPPALDTTIVAVFTDRHIGGERLVGYGFSSIGRFAQDGLIRARFAPRLLTANWHALMDVDGIAIDPVKAWTVMMTGEKPGGHGERCVAVGTLDMAMWDLAAKARGLPLYKLLQQVYGRQDLGSAVPCYAGGGYPFPSEELSRLRDETHSFKAMGFTSTKMKIGAFSLREDCRRIEIAMAVLGSGDRLAVDAMNIYAPDQAQEAARTLEPYGLRWLEDICDPLDFCTHSIIAAAYSPPISTGEAVFSSADAQNIVRYAGLRAGHDVLTFDPAHCYGIPGFVRIIEVFEKAGWSSQDFLPHGGHLYGLQLARGLGLGGCECNPHNFQPFGGFADGTTIRDGHTTLPELPGIGFEGRKSLIDLFRSLR